MPVDLAAIFIGVLAIIVSVVAGVYAASAISSEYVAQITARLISLERKVDRILEQQKSLPDPSANGLSPTPPSPPLLEEHSAGDWPAPTSTNE
jgi:hypothetical protein